jgi:iron complex outermembrane receptor protein
MTRHVGPPALLLLAAPIASLAGTELLLDEVVVTARKVSEPALEVPLAMQVLDRQALQRGSVDGLYALAARAPGLSFESVWGGGVGLPTIRGQFAPSLGDTVGVFVDGVYQASRNALDVELLDFERVEIAHGPQGTLYGNSTFAGAIGYVSQPPSQQLEAGAGVDLGNGDLVASQAWVSGPVGSRWLGRLAAVNRRFGGTARSASDPDQHLGGYERSAVAATLATHPDRPISVRLLARLQDGNYAHPAASFVDGQDYNCGGQDAASGLWSYYCGSLPARAPYHISPDLPDSESRVGQVALQLGIPLGSLRLDAELSYYDARTDLVRDYDASADGIEYGVCTTGVNCTGPPGVERLLTRRVFADEVARDLQDLAQSTLEVRLSGTADELSWMAGAVVIETLDDTTARFGVERGDLQAVERLTALLPATPERVGPLSIANEALVDDPSRAQAVRQDVSTQKTTWAAFGTLEYSLGDRWRLRGELRGTHEQLELDSRVVNFRTSFGKAIAAQDFEDVTARFSATWLVAPTSRAYASAARGSRAGGINPLPGLPPDEQTYDPESNWTYELGWRHQDTDWLRSAAVTVYYIDWSDTQIGGLPSQPGLNNLILVNTAGLTTRGAELALTLAPTDWLAADLAWSIADPRFRAGSDDYGSSTFCGLSANSQDSTLCVIGPPRTINANSPPLLPWLDGNAPGRAPRNTWHAALTAQWPDAAAPLRPWGRVDVNHQDDVYERQINGARFGQRTLVDARVGLQSGRWSFELWGLNLADDEYLRASFARLPVLYPTQPRPLDLIHADGRRYGVTVRWSMN